MVHQSSPGLWYRCRSPTPFLLNTGITCIICSTFTMSGCARIFMSHLVALLAEEGNERRNGIQRITPEEASWLCSLPSLTSPIGFLLGGYVTDALGRKCSIQCALIPFFIGWALILQANHLNSLYAAGICHGIASGISMTASSYVSEMASLQYRGLFLSFLPVSYMLGTVVSCTLVNMFGWAKGAVYLFAVSLTMYGTVFFIPESPYWLALKGHTGAAIQVLESIRQDDDIVATEIVDIQKCTPFARHASVDAHETLPLPDTGVRALWNVRRQIAMLTTLAILHKFTGYTPLNQYTLHFFQALHIPVAADKATFSHTMVCLGSTFAVPYFMYNYDKRPLLFVTSILAGLSMAVTLVSEFCWANYASWRVPFSRWLSLVGVYGYDVASTIGLTSVLVMLPAELLPTEVSGVACALYSILSSTITAATVKTYLQLLGAVGLPTMLAIFVVCCFLVAAFAVTILPETRGKTLNEIQKAYFSRDVPRTVRANEQTIADSRQIQMANSIMIRI